MMTVEPLEPRTKFYRDDARSIITFNDSPDIPFRAGVSPYRGCEHGCAYCFARPTHEYLGFSAGTGFRDEDHGQGARAGVAPRGAFQKKLGAAADRHERRHGCVSADRAPARAHPESASRCSRNFGSRFRSSPKIISSHVTSICSSNSPGGRRFPSPSRSPRSTVIWRRNSSRAPHAHSAGSRPFPN